MFEEPISDEARVLITIFFAEIARKAQRLRYRDERKHPEWVDVGGEGGES